MLSDRDFCMLGGAHEMQMNHVADSPDLTFDDLATAYLEDYELQGCRVESGRRDA